jgi:hypothetical protein
LITAGKPIYWFSIGDAMISPAIVLTTVNAPYSQKLDALALVHCLLNPAAAKAKAGYMSSFFGDVKPELQKAFAEHFSIDQSQLEAAAKDFSEYSGEKYPLAA